MKHPGRLAGRPWVLGVSLALLVGLPLGVHAEPYLAVQNGFKCSQCHVNPTGGGLRNTFGEVFSQVQMPLYHINTPEPWTGGPLLDVLTVGADVRYDVESDQMRGQPSVDSHDLQQARVYGEVNLLPERLAVYADEQVGPGYPFVREIYGLFWSANHEWYAKAGQMYLPFGLRLQDQTAFVQEVSGINMTTPDRAIEVGWLHGPWDAQFAVSNGTDGGPSTGSGKQYSTQLIYVTPTWRLGATTNLNEAGSASRTVAGLFGGLKTGPVAWLAEADFVDDATIAGYGRKRAAGLLEADWLITRGQNLKITAEQFLPDTSVRHNEQARWSLVYELTPVQFVQLRTGVRYTDGIPQDNFEHVKIYFAELHVYL